MTIENKLRELILSRYKSIREFSRSVGLPNSTVDSIFKRGIANSSINNIITICKHLHISADALSDGDIVFRFTDVEPHTMVDIDHIIEDVKFQLNHASQIYVKGQLIDIETAEPLIEALDIGYELTRKKQSKKHTKNVTLT